MNKAVQRIVKLQADQQGNVSVPEYRESIAAPRTRQTAAPAAKTDKAELQAAREWLQAQGHKVGDRGRIKAELMELYRSQVG